MLYFHMKIINSLIEEPSIYYELLHSANQDNQVCGC